MTSILPGQRFKKLVTLAYFTKKSPSGRSYGYWLCRCDCGGTTEVRADSLKLRVSCGCKTRETHGKTRTKVYAVWHTMKSRCNNPKHISYPCYGGKGIKVCQRWEESFSAFCEDVGPPPSGCSIERIDNSKDYCPENCKWATNGEQANNKTNNRRIEFNGEIKTLAQWAKDTGIHRNAISRRIDEYGWTVEQALTIPSGKSGRKPNVFWERQPNRDNGTRHDRHA